MKVNSTLGIIFSDAYSDAVSDLTALRTMASVPFGGRYRFIDFPLSNMVNCGITKVGVITKSNFQSLMDHIGTGKPWDLSRKTDGLFLLPPFSLKEGVYSGKMQALTYISNFIRTSREEYVVLYDANIVCSTNLGRMIDEHIASGADMTIAYRKGRIPMLENVLHLALDADERVTKVTVPAKPEKAEGVFGVNILVMKKALLERLINEADAENFTDFERDVIMRNQDRLNIRGWRINDYCAVIDSLQTYYDANMDLLKRETRASLFKAKHPVYTKINDDMPSNYGLGSHVTNSVVADGCIIEGTVENCVLFRGVRIGKDAVVRDSIIMQGSIVGEKSKLRSVIIDKHTAISAGKELSGDPTYPIYIGKKLVI